MVFGIQELRNQIEAVTEERNFFQSKYLEQVSLLQDLQNELKKSKREINRLREELMARPRRNSNNANATLLEQTRSPFRPAAAAAAAAAAAEEKKDDGDPPSASDDHSIPNSPSGLTCDDEEGSVAAAVDDDEEVEVDIDEKEAIRESASKLLQWANYRGQTRSSLGPPDEE